jgi:hypothetical protein
MVRDPAGIMGGFDVFANIILVTSPRHAAKIRAFWDLVRREVAGAPAPAPRPWR